MKLIITIILLANILYANIGNIVSLRGDVEVIRDNNTNKNIQIGFALEKNDLIKTGKKAKLQIVFSDETIITLGKESEFKVYDYFYNKENKQTKPKASFGFLKGSFKSVTGQIGKIAKNRFKLKTNTSSIGIRGTTIVGITSPLGDRLACTDGAIAVGSLRLGGLPVIVPAGKITIIKPNKLPTPPRNYSPTEITSMENETTIDKGDKEKDTKDNENQEQKDTTEENKQEEQATTETTTEQPVVTPVVDTTEVVADAIKDTIVETIENSVDDAIQQAEADRIAAEQAEAERLAAIALENARNSVKTQINSIDTSSQFFSTASIEMSIDSLNEFNDNYYLVRYAPLEYLLQSKKDELYTNIVNDLSALMTEETINSLDIASTEDLSLDDFNYQYYQTLLANQTFYDNVKDLLPQEYLEKLTPLDTINEELYTKALAISVNKGFTELTNLSITAKTNTDELNQNLIDIATNESNIVTANSNISSYQSKISTSNSNISSYQAVINSNPQIRVVVDEKCGIYSWKWKCFDVYGYVTDTAKINLYKSKISTEQNNINSYNSSISTLQSNIATYNTNIENLTNNYEELANTTIYDETFVTNLVSLTKHIKEYRQKDTDIRATLESSDIDSQEDYENIISTIDYEELHKEVSNTFKDLFVLGTNDNLELLKTNFSDSSKFDTQEFFDSIINSQSNFVELVNLNETIKDDLHVDYQTELNTLFADDSNFIEKYRDITLTKDILKLKQQTSHFVGINDKELSIITDIAQKSINNEVGFSTDLKNKIAELSYELSTIMTTDTDTSHLAKIQNTPGSDYLEIGYWDSIDDTDPTQQFTWLKDIETTAESKIQELMDQKVTATYTGHAYGTTVTTKGLDKILVDTNNEVKMNINFGTPNVDGHIKFNTNGGQSWNSTFDTGSVTTSGFDVTNFTSNHSGTINGKYYGDQAQAVGGRFKIKDTSTNNQAVGVFGATK
jgi:uncharacterized protein YdcH (DUF465 family)